MALLALVLVPLMTMIGLFAFFESQSRELERVPIEGLGPQPTTAAEPVAAEDRVAAEEPTTPGAARVEDQRSPGAADEPAIAVAEMPDVELGAPQPPTNSRRTLLVVGADGERLDTLGLVRINPARDMVTLLPLSPELIGETTTGPITMSDALQQSRSTLVQAVRSVVDLQIDHYIEIDYPGFERLLELSGGLEVGFEQPVRDNAEGFAVDVGCQVLDAADAAALLRSTSIEVQDQATGAWQSRSSELDRAARQVDLARVLYAQLLAADHDRIDKARIVADVLDDITVDDGLDADALGALFHTAEQMGPDRFRTVELGGLSEQRLGDDAAIAATPAAAAAAADEFIIPRGAAGARVAPDQPTAATQLCG